MSGKPLPLPPPPPVTSSNTRPSSSGAGAINSTSSGGGQSNSSSNNSNNNRRPNLWSRTTNSGQQSERTPSTSTSSRQPLPPPPTSNPTRDRWNSSSTNRPTLFQQQQQQQRPFLINKEKDSYQKLDARASSAQISTRPAKPSMLGNSNISGSGGITTGSNSSRLYSSGGGSGNTSSGGAGGASDALNSGSSSSGGPRMGSGGGPSQLSQFQKRRNNFDGPGDNSNNQTYLSPKRPRLMNGGGGGGSSGSSGKDRYQLQQQQPQGGYSSNAPNQGVPRRSIFGGSATYDEYKRCDNYPSMLRNDGGSGGYGNDYRSSNYNSYNSSGGGYSRGPGGMGKSGMGGGPYGRSSMLNPNNHPSSTRDYHPPSSNTGFNRSNINGSSNGYNNSNNSQANKHPSQNPSIVAKSTTSSTINIKINNNNARNISIIGGSKAKVPASTISKEEQEEGLIAGTPDNYEDTPTMRSMEEEEEEGEIDLDGEDDGEEGEGDLEEEEEEERAIDDQQLQMEEDDEAAAAEAEAMEQEAIDAAASAQESDTATIAAPTSTSTAAAATTSTNLTEPKPKPIVRKPFGASIDISGVTARILAENQERAKTNSRQILAELKEAVVPVVIRKNVEDYPCIQEILAAHKKFRPHLQEYIADRKQDMEEKRLELRQEYADHYATYKKKMAREKKRKGGLSSAQGPALAYGINNSGGSSSALGALSGEYGGGFGTRSSRRGGNSSAFTSDAVKSEAEWEQVLAAIAATEQAETDDSKLIALTVPDPPMITDPLERQIYNFQNFNRLVLDPVVELANVNAALEMKWSEGDRELFRYKLVQYGKDFPKIASYMRNKTTQDCIQYYYREKFSGSFKQLLRKAANSRANMRRRMNMAAKKPPITKSDSRASMTTSRNANSIIEEREQQNDNQQEQPQSNDQEDKNVATPTITKVTTAEQSKPSPTSTSDQPPASTIPPAQPTQTPTPAAAPAAAPAPTRSKPKPRQPQHQALAIEETSKFTISDIQDSPSTRWTVDEKSRAFSAFSQYGRDFEAVATAVGSKTTANVSEFYQLYKRKYKLDAVVAEVEAGKVNGGGKDGEKKKSGGGSGRKGKQQQVVERGESVALMDVDAASQGGGVEFVKKEEQQQQQHTSDGSWLKHERDDFLKGLRLYGCNWEQVSKIVGTKSIRKCRILYQSCREEFDSVLLEAGYKPENSVEHQTAPVQPVAAATTPAMVYQTDQSGSYVYYAHPQPVVYAYAQAPPPQPQQVFHPMHGYHDPIPGQYAQPQEYPGASYAVGPYLDVRGPQFGPQGYAVYGQPVFYQGVAPPAYGTQQQHEAQQYHQQQQQQQQQHIQHQKQIQHQQQHQLQQEQNSRASLPPQQPQQQQQNNGSENTVLPSIRNLISD
ncbi:UNVERIFIED_CONTAM: nuclear receptor co-repressor 1 [Siphonaria sp. JEL0065]|nr:nuclear receptor co-repressor 1 [Siphonaria sp. JEL0065]